MFDYKEINEWEVLTPEGWCEFSGVVKTKKKKITVSFESGKEITCSETHRFQLKSGDFIEAQHLLVKDTLIGKDGTEIVKSIEFHNDEDVLYDLTGINNNSSSYYTDGLSSHNCDEMAFIPTRIQTEFMAGTAPALSATRGKMIITSTPNGSRDLFAKIWFNSGMVWDKKEYTYLRKNPPKNEFEPLFIPYWIDPTKNNDEWISREKRTLDDPIKWKVEFECLGGETEVEVYDRETGEQKVLTLEEIYDTLLKDEISRNLIITENTLPDEIEHDDVWYKLSDDTKNLLMAKINLDVDVKKARKEIEEKIPKEEENFEDD